MTRAEVRALLKQGVANLGNQIKFNSGRITEFNKELNKDFPYVWLESLQSDTTVIIGQANIDKYKVVQHIANKDSADSTPEEYEAILDDCDYIAQQLILQYKLLVSDLTTMDSVSRVPFIHKHADNTTGIILSFELNSPDTTNVC